MLWVTLLMLMGSFCRLFCQDLMSPTSGLYFTLRGSQYLPGDAALVQDIGTFGGTDPEFTGGALTCHTDNVNTQCCRQIDGGNIGEWFFPNGTIVPRNSDHAGRSTFTRSGSTRQVRLNRNLDVIGPLGVFECRVPDSSGKLQNASIAIVASDHDLLLPTRGTDINTGNTAVLFQLRLLGVGDCESWIDESAPEKGNAVTQAIVTQILSRCRCNFTVNHIAMRGFECFNQSPQAVTYRAQLQSTNSITAVELLHIIEMWVRNGATLSILFRQTHVDSLCGVQISSFTDKECGGQTGDDSGESEIGGAIGGVILVILMCAIGVVILVLTMYKWRPALSKRSDTANKPSAEYEDIDASAHSPFKNAVATSQVPPPPLRTSSHQPHKLSSTHLRASAPQIPPPPTPYPASSHHLTSSCDQLTTPSQVLSTTRKPMAHSSSCDEVTLPNLYSRPFESSQPHAHHMTHSGSPVLTPCPAYLFHSPSGQSSGIPKSKSMSVQGSKFSRTLVNLEAAYADSEV